MLSALREIGDMREGHTASLKGLRQMSKDDVVLGELVDQELARLSNQLTADEGRGQDLASRRETVLHAINESETKFVEALKEVRGKIKAQQQTIERLQEYFTKVKDELKYATQQLLEHNRERANLEQNTVILTEELEKLGTQGTLIKKDIKAKQNTEQELQQQIDNEILDFQGQVTDMQEQIDAETQVLGGLSEYLARTRVQLQELDGSVEAKGNRKLLEGCGEIFGQELEAVKEEHNNRKESLVELEGKETALKEELEAESARLTKEERGMAYKIEVDSRAMAIKRGYAANLNKDVEACGTKLGVSVAVPTYPPEDESPAPRSRSSTMQSGAED